MLAKNNMHFNRIKKQLQLIFSCKKYEQLLFYQFQSWKVIFTNIDFLKCC